MGFYPFQPSTTTSGFPSEPVVTGTPSAGLTLTAVSSTSAKWEAAPVDYQNVVTTWGASGNGVTLADGAVATTAPTAFTSASAAFAAGDAGKTIVVQGAGVAGAALVTTIAAVVSAGAVTLTAGASTTVTGATYFYGTLNDTQFANAAAAFSYPAETTDPPLPTGGAIYIPSGVYAISSALNWKLPGLKVLTDGPGAVIIVQTAQNTPILQVAGSYQNIGALTLAYAAPQTSSQTSSIGVEFGDDTVGSCFMSHFGQLVVQQSATGLAVNPAVAAVAGLFSCTFEDIVVTGFAISAVNLNGNNGGGLANCTGCVFSNIYINNLNAAGTQQGSTSYAGIFLNWDDLVIGQLNIEHATLTSTHALAFSFVSGAVINSLHFERLTMSATSQGLLYQSHAGTFVIGAMTSKFNTYNGSAENPVVFFNGTGPTQTMINGFSESHCTVTTPSHPYVDFGTATNCLVLISGVSATQTTATAVNAGAGDAVQLGAVAIGGGITPFTAGWSVWPTGGTLNAINVSSGADITPVAGTWYVAACYIGCNCTLTGIIAGSNSGTGADDWMAAIWNSAGGAPLATSSLSGIASPAAGAKAAFAFTAQLAVQGPGLYFVGVQSNGTTDKLLCFANNLEGFFTTSHTGVFGTPLSLTPPSTYTVNVGPFANTY
jgi:hypothetical protein